MIENLVAVLYEKPVSNPNFKERVLTPEQLVDELKNIGLELNTGSLSWVVVDKKDRNMVAGSSYGQSVNFRMWGLQDTDYSLGIYDTQKVEHLQSMINGVRFRAEARGEGVSD